VLIFDYCAIGLFLGAEYLWYRGQNWKKRRNSFVPISLSDKDIIRALLGTSALIWYNKPKNISTQLKEQEKILRNFCFVVISENQRSWSTMIHLGSGSVGLQSKILDLDPSTHIGLKKVLHVCWNESMIKVNICWNVDVYGCNDNY